MASGLEETVHRKPLANCSCAVNTDENNIVSTKGLAPRRRSINDIRLAIKSISKDKEAEKHNLHKNEDSLVTRNHSLFIFTSFCLSASFSLG